MKLFPVEYWIHDSHSLLWYIRRPVSNGCVELSIRKYNTLQLLFFPWLIAFTRAFSKELVVWRITWYDTAYFCAQVRYGVHPPPSRYPLSLKTWHKIVWSIIHSFYASSGANHYPSLNVISAVTMLSYNWSPCVPFLSHNFTPLWPLDRKTKHLS